MRRTINFVCALITHIAIGRKICKYQTYVIAHKAANSG